MMPIGPARLAELHPGLSADAMVLLPGFALLVLLLVAVAADSLAGVGRPARRCLRPADAGLPLSAPCAGWPVPALRSGRHRCPDGAGLRPGPVRRAGTARPDRHRRCRSLR